MLFRDTAVLVQSTAAGHDSAGYPLNVEVKSEVFVDKQSVKRSEFYSGRKSGLALTIAFLLRSCDYAGQSEIEYAGKRYRVERTFSRDGELLELNCSEAVKGK